MRIGIGQSALSAKHAGFYVVQLKQEGHEITPISEIDTNCTVLEVYICDNLDELILLVDIVRHLLFFPTKYNQHEKEPKGIVRVGSWWEIYNHIRYEI